MESRYIEMKINNVGKAYSIVFFKYFIQLRLINNIRRVVVIKGVVVIKVVIL